MLTTGPDEVYASLQAYFKIEDDGYLPWDRAGPPPRCLNPYKAA